ncbi:ECF transporter S component [Anaeromicrobium sediminis]|uniref:ECF transporter S component n=1 Tax=Anaeromicrobium sediminis TaxID=1478221 RepID=A0A267MLV7_9FIRM|nr:ECF transporter S component [Anaeromicrobium sediminis]PAB59898.1 hypothetical protein CCE28_08065 [Anaeromicrobium sediminis]
MEVLNKKRVSSKKLTLTAMMVAITVLLDYTIGVIPLPMVAITIVHLPTVIAGIVMGPVMGAVVGFCMGAASLIHSITRPPSPLSVLFINPIISIVPRIFIGVMAYYGYEFVKKLFKGQKESVGVFIGAAIGSLTNTVGVLGMLYLVYADKIEQILEGTTAKAFVITVASTNGMAEAIAAGIVCTPIVVAVKKIYK